MGLCSLERERGLERLVLAVEGLVDSVDDRGFGCDIERLRVDVGVAAGGVLGTRRMVETGRGMSGIAGYSKLDESLLVTSLLEDDSLVEESNERVTSFGLSKNGVSGEA